jgi:hypothetical protein
MVRFVVIACLLFASCHALSNPRRCVERGDLPVSVKVEISDANGKVVCNSTPCKIKPNQNIDTFVTFGNGKIIISICAFPCVFIHVTMYKTYISPTNG